MSDAFFALIAQQGALLLFVTTFLSCLALPLPASLMMLSAGAFVASGDLGAGETLLASLGGAVAGDQVGYLVARYLETRLERYFTRHPSRAALLQKARALSRKWGGPGVFFSRWLVSPLGPYVNFTAGAMGLTWRRFLLWDVLGEATWVSLYLGLGYGFASQIGALADILGNVSGFLASLALMAGLGIALARTRRKP